MKQILYTLTAFLAATTLLAEESKPWYERSKVSGLAFGDAYWVAANHEEEIEDENGFWFRRIYLTFDHELSEALALRLRFEMNSPGDFSTSTNLEPFVKDAYLRWKWHRQEVFFGLSPTPTWSVVEEEWGYRAVEKTPVDLQRMGAARDLGVAIRGSFDEAGKVRYHAMVGNGSGTRSETNPGKKVLFSLGWSPVESLLVELYGDFEDRPGRTDRVTFQGFLTYRWKRGRVGLQVVRQNRQVPGGPSLNLDLASIYGVRRLGEKVSVFARYDRMFDPNPEGDDIAYIPFDPTAKSNFVVAGIDLALHRHVNFLPNVEVVWYDAPDGGPRPDRDVIPRVTLSLTF